MSGKKKSKVTPKMLAEISRLGSMVSVSLTFSEAADIQVKLETMPESETRGVLARVLQAFIRNPTSQRLVVDRECAGTAHATGRRR